MNGTTEKNGLVLEGGGLRGMFTCGVLDVFMANGITFDGLAGVSSGVLFGCNMKSMQPGRALRYNIKYKDDPDYMSWGSLIGTGNYVNVSFSYYMLPYVYDKFDFDDFASNPMKFYAVCTDIEQGCAVYKEIADARGIGMEWMRASASMPVFSRPVKLSGHYYLDGGMSDSIPLKFMQNEGYARNIVVLTQPSNFRKKKAHVKGIIRIMHRKFPKVAELMSKRHLMYNEQLDYVHAEQQKGNTLVICPDHKIDIGRLSLNEQKMRAAYDAGVKKATEMLPQIKAFIDRK